MKRFLSLLLAMLLLSGIALADGSLELLPFVGGTVSELAEVIGDCDLDASAVTAKDYSIMALTNDEGQINYMQFTSDAYTFCGLWCGMDLESVQQMLQDQDAAVSDEDFSADKVLYATMDDTISL